MNVSAGGTGFIETNPATFSGCACISIAGTNRDPAVFPDPDRFDVGRDKAHRHGMFAHGPHVCIGECPWRAGGPTAVDGCCAACRLCAWTPARPAEPRGLVFRKPPQLYVLRTPQSAPPTTRRP